MASQSAKSRMLTAALEDSGDEKSEGTRNRRNFVERMA